jgi:hypothetical protein
MARCFSPPLDRPTTGFTESLTKRFGTASRLDSRFTQTPKCPSAASLLPLAHVVKRALATSLKIVTTTGCCSRPQVPSAQTPKCPSAQVPKFCPLSGKLVVIDTFEDQNQSPMTVVSPIDDLLDHLATTSGLSRDQAMKIVAEVLTYFDEPLEIFVRRRHRELQSEGLANAAIYQRIRNDLKFWRVAAPETSERQIRRIIYG